MLVFVLVSKVLGFGGIVGLGSGSSRICSSGHEFRVIKDSLDLIFILSCVEGWVGLIVGMIVESL
jgi:hypothetical protein